MKPQRKTNSWHHLLTTCLLIFMLAFTQLGCTKSDSEETTPADDSETAGTDVTPVTTPTYSVGGTISGQTDSVVLQNNGEDDLTITSTDSTFTFSKKLANGEDYRVTTLTHPSGQNCVVTEGNGTIDSADVGDLSVVCESSFKASTVSLDGSVLDAALAYAKVSLKAVGSSTSLSDVVQTDISGTYSLTNVDLGEVGSSAVLFLEVTGQGTSCDNNTTSATFADIDDTGTYDILKDNCIAETTYPLFKSFLGTADTVQFLGGQDETARIDSANLPGLTVTHITSAKAAIVENLLKDVSDDSEKDAKVSYLMDSVNTLMEQDESFKKQIAKIATVVRAAAHGKTLPGDLETKKNSGGIMALAEGMASGEVTLDDTANTFINTELANDVDGLISSTLNLDASTDLSDVTFENTELTSTLNDFTAIQSLTDQLITMLAEYASASETPVNEAGLDAYQNQHVHAKYLTNGQTGSQRTARNKVHFTDNPVTEMSWLGVGLSRYADATGNFYFNTATEAFTRDPTDLPVYRMLGSSLTKYEDGRFENSSLSGSFAVVEDDALKIIGNLKKFRIELAAQNDKGMKKIKLTVADPNLDTHGGRFKITGVKIEVAGDSNLSALTSEQLWWNSDGSQKFRTDCDANSDPTDNKNVCLNAFFLQSHVKSNLAHAWSHFLRPGSSLVTTAYNIPGTYTPQTGATYRFTISYDDTLGAAGQTFIKERKMGRVPSNDRLAKLLKSDKTLLASEVVGNDTEINLSWTYKKLQDDPRIIFPEGAYQVISLKDMFGAYVNVPNTSGTGRVGANVRSAKITGDFSALKLLRAQVDLYLPDGSEVHNIFQMFKYSDNAWTITYFRDIHLSVGCLRWYNGGDSSDEFDSNCWHDLRVDSDREFAPELTFYSSDYEVTDLTYNYALARYTGSLTATDTIDWPVTLTLQYTPGFNSQPQEVPVTLLYSVEDEHFVNNPQVNLKSGTTDTILITWEAPTSANTLNKLAGWGKYRIEIIEQNSEEQLVNYRDDTDNLNYEFTLDSTTDLRVNFRANHNDWITGAGIQLNCTWEQITTSACKLQ